jgi:hypothetical protein
MEAPISPPRPMRNCSAPAVGSLEVSGREVRRVSRERRIGSRQFVTRGNAARGRSVGRARAGAASPARTLPLPARFRPARSRSHPAWPRGFRTCAGPCWPIGSRSRAERRACTRPGARGGPVPGCDRYVEAVARPNGRIEPGHTRSTWTPEPEPRLNASEPAEGERIRTGCLARSRMVPLRNRRATPRVPSHARLPASVVHEQDRVREFHLVHGGGVIEHPLVPILRPALPAVLHHAPGQLDDVVVTHADGAVRRGLAQ